MPKASLRFYNELNEILPENRRSSYIEAEFTEKRSVKDMIEALGVPHTEIDVILANGRSVDFGYILKDGDRICVYPVCETPDISDVIHLKPIPGCRSRFVADINIRDIVRYMRALGLDVYFNPSSSARDIIGISKKEDRIILTRSKKLLKHNDAVLGILLRRGPLEEQVRDVIQRLGIREEVKPFSRCLKCNSFLKDVNKSDIEERLPQKTRAYCDKYAICMSCNKIYWEGSHVVEMKRVIKEILKSNNSGARSGIQNRR